MRGRTSLDVFSASAPWPIPVLLVDTKTIFCMAGRQVVVDSVEPCGKGGCYVSRCGLSTMIAHWRSLACSSRATAGGLACSQQRASISGGRGWWAGRIPDDDVDSTSEAPECCA